MLPDVIESARINEIPAKDLQDTEDKYENFVFLVTRKALGKYESNKEEGRVKGNKKPPKDTTLVEAAGAIALGAAGAPFGLIGTGASAGATISKIMHELIYGYFHREKAKAIVESIEKSGIDETQILNMFASIGAEIFRVFEYQLSLLEVSDLEKVAHDVVIRVYNAIADKPNIWDKDECERSVLLAKSATEPGAILAEISRGHNVNSIEAWKSKDLLSKAGIYDDKNHFVCDNTDSLKYKFRRPFKNEEIDRKVWRLANNDQIGSFQPQYFVNEEMATRVKENAISKIKAANPTMAAKQNAIYSADAKDAFKEDRILAEELHAKVSDVSEQLEIEKAQAGLLVTKNQEINSSLSKVAVEAYTKQAKSANIEERVRTVYIKDVRYRELAQKADSEFEKLNADLTRIAEDQQRKWKIDTVLKADEPDLSYFQRNKPYRKLKKFYDNHPENTLSSARFAVIVGEKGVGKSDMARSFANNQFKGKHVLWIKATNEETLKEAFIAIATKFKINDIENKDLKDIQKEVYSRVARDQALVVFDDVYMFEAIQPFMPWEILPDERSPNVLVTSNNDEFHWEEVRGFYDCEIIKLEPFDDNECFQFVKDFLQEGGYDVVKMGDKDEDIRELGKVLNSLPANLVAALNDIFNKKCTLTDYVNSIRSTK